MSDIRVALVGGSEQYGPRLPDADEKRASMTVFLGSVFAMELTAKLRSRSRRRISPKPSSYAKEDWVREDLIGMTSNGVPLCSSTAKLTIRRADQAEIAIYRDAALKAQ